MHKRWRVFLSSHSATINSQQPNRLLKELFINELRWFLIATDILLMSLALIFPIMGELIRATDTTTEKDKEEREKWKIPMLYGSIWTVSIVVFGFFSWMPTILLGENKNTNIWSSWLIIVRLLLSLAFVLFLIFNVAARHFINYLAAGFLLASALCRLVAIALRLIGFKLFDWLAEYTPFELFKTLASYNEGEDANGYAFNWAMKEPLVYLTNDQRLMMQNLAIDQIKGDWSAIKRDAFWYSPMHHMKIEKPDASDEGSGLLGDLEETLDETRRGNNKSRIQAAKGAKATLFSPCYCCLDSDLRRCLQKITPKTDKRQETFRRRTQRRKEFLQEQPKSHIGSSMENLDHRAHLLCTMCENMCNSSTVINSRPTPNSKKFKETNKSRFKHWPTVGDLKISAEKGCHLCSLIWHTLSPDQQVKLLEIDAQLDAELQVRLAEVTGDVSDGEELDKKISRINLRFHRKRCIVIVIEKNGLFSHTAVAELESDLHSVDDWIRDLAPRLVPHFGDSRIAQRWLPQRSASRAISLGVDPATEWHKEQAAGIRLSPLFGRYAGMGSFSPVVLPVSKSTGSDITMTFIKSVLDAHEHCHIHANSFPSHTNLDHGNGSAVELLGVVPSSSHLPNTKLPTRLIDVGTGESKEVRIRTSTAISDQQESSLYNEPKGTKYLALSHCWGTHPFLVLTDENKHRLFRGIDPSELAQTFQDAISVTRRLGYRYLWIDCLCIIQQSKEDWNREAPTMKDVYSNAAAVIAAVSTWDSTESMFSDQNPLAASPCLVSVAGGSKDFWNGIYACPPSRYNTDAWDNDVRFSRLRSRAWCFQEEYLAKRIIYFGQHQVFFSCKSPDPKLKDCIVSQTGAYPWNPDDGLVHKSKNETPAESMGLIKALASARHGSMSDYVDALFIWGMGIYRRYPSSFSVREGGLVESDPPEYLLKAGWWETVREYSTRYLTHESDRIAALAGIAPYIKNLEPAAVDIFGLWGAEHLTMGLLWYVSHGPQKLPTNPQIPTWSWVSTGGTIDNNSTSGSAATSRVVIKSLERDDSHPEEETRNAFGMDQPVKINIRGALKKGKWGTYKPTNRHYYRGHKRPAEETVTESHLFYYNPVTRDPLIGPEVFKLRDAAGKRVGWIVPDTLEEMPEDIYCLRIVVEPEADGMKDDFGIPWATRGLVLRPTGTESEYKRIGYFELNKTHGSFTWPGVWKGQLSNRGVVLPIRRPGPVIDVEGFFDGCADEEICII